MKTLSGLDGLFLHLETAETPMHVASLSVLELPKGYRGDFFQDVKRLYASRLPMAPVLSRVLREMPLRLANPVWVQADEIDWDYHLRRVVLPKPGTQAQLEACAAQLHAVPLDRRHPLWTVTLIEGLPRRRVAYYFNIHHAVLDGQASVELAKLTFDLTPKPRRVARTKAAAPSAAGVEHPWPGALVAGALRHDAEQVAKFAQLLPEITRTITAVRRAANAHASNDAATPGQMFAPKTPLNVAIGAGRGFAAVSIPLAEVHHVAAVQQATVNDVVLAICAGALRRYLGRHGGVPDRALLAGIPISLREGAATEFTTQATAARVTLATDIADPVRRLQAIRASTSEAKANMGRMKSVLPTDFPTLGLPWLLHGLATLYGQSRIANFVPPLFNLVVSNFRGPPVPLYLAGARMLRYWPMSIVAHGLAANITVESYAGSLEFGVITASNAVPKPRQLADGLVAAHAQLVQRSR
ncbi:MAG TPA: wax ester/triacylglycerol synthase family O-acyltransferase [Steroidobacteraceae bacterium]|nr:wax ester/triacylglycerol synthase family O-acyltransferase [Steroidobacteraceae bacterium]